MSTAQARLHFSEAWPAASHVDGWLSPHEASNLYRAAVEWVDGTWDDGIIVEVGAYRGRSTVLLAQSGYEVRTFDPMEPGEYPDEGMTITENDAAKLAANIVELMNVQWFRCPATAEHLEDSIRLLYIDGKHSGEQPYFDWLTFRPHMLKGSRVAFHDYTTRPEVRRAVARAEAAGDIKAQGLYGSLYIGKVCF